MTCKPGTETVREIKVSSISGSIARSTVLTLGLVMLSVNQVEAMNKQEYCSRRAEITGQVSDHSPPWAALCTKTRRREELTAMAGMIGVGKTIPRLSASVNLPPTLSKGNNPCNAQNVISHAKFGCLDHAQRPLVMKPLWASLGVQVRSNGPSR